MILSKRLFQASLIIALAGCSTSPSKDDKLKSADAKSESQSVKKVTAIDMDIEKEIAKDSASISYDRFRSAYSSRREDNIVAAGSELLAKNPNDEKVLKAMGGYYVQQNKPGIAKVYFDRVLEKNPKDADINNMLGLIAMQENKEAEAQRYFKLALQGNDDHVEANFNLGTYYLKYMDYAKAERFLEVAYGNNKKDPAIANNYAIALRGVGNINKALNVYKGIETKGSRVPSLLNQAILLAEYKKDFKEAKEVLNKIRFITTDPLVLKKVNELTKIVDQK